MLAYGYGIDFWQHQSCNPHIYMSSASYFVVRCFFFADCAPPPVRMHQMGNNNSSRYGVVTQLQFDDGDIPKMVGSLNRTYLLEKSRVVSRSSRERNFHVFYQMVGSDDEEFKKSLQLSGLAWHHLSYSKPSLPLCGNEDPLISIGSVGVAL